MSMHVKIFGVPFEPGIKCRLDKDGKVVKTPVERTRAKQAFKDECDVNRIVERMSRGVLERRIDVDSARYGDFTDWPDLLEAQRRLNNGVELFEKLPAEIRREFGNNAGSFFSWANDPENSDRLQEVLQPMLAPGRQRPNPVMRSEASSPSGADPVAAPTPPASSGETSSGDD